MSDVPNVSDAIAEFVAALPEPPLPGAAEPSAPTPSPSKASASGPEALSAPAKEPEKAAEPEKPDERYARGYARLAQREAALQAKEKDLEAKYAESLKVTQSNLASKFKANPLRTLKELGLDNEAISQLGRAALGATLDNAPQQYRDLAEKLRLDDQNASLKEEFEQFKARLTEEKEQERRASAAEAYRREYQANLSKHVQSPELSKEAPNVAALYAARPDATLRRILGLVAQDAQAKSRSGQGEPLTEREAVMALESELADLAPIFRPGGTPEPVRVPSQPARPNLSDSAVNPAPASRAMPDPEKDWAAWKKAQEEAWFADLHRESLRKGQ